MSKMDVATKFFHACEGLEGRSGCQQYVADGASFEAQSEPIADVTTALDYCDWMRDLGQGPLNGCSYAIVTSSFDEKNSTGLFFGVFTGKHVGDLLDTITKEAAVITFIIGKLCITVNRRFDMCNI